MNMFSNKQPENTEQTKTAKQYYLSNPSFYQELKELLQCVLLVLSIATFLSFVIGSISFTTLFYIAYKDQKCPPDYTCYNNRHLQQNEFSISPLD